MVDTNGLLMAVSVVPASVQDRDGAKEVLGFCLGTYPRLKTVWADAAYGGQFIEWAKKLLGMTLQIVRRTDSGFTEEGFVVLPRRWVVERTFAAKARVREPNFAWLGKYRRLSKDYEELPASSEAWIRLAMIHIMLRRLA